MSPFELFIVAAGLSLLIMGGLRGIRERRIVAYLRRPGEVLFREHHGRAAVIRGWVYLVIGLVAAGYTTYLLLVSGS